MKGHARRLLLTRPRKQSRRFLAECEALSGQSIEAVISPIIDIVPFDNRADLGVARTIVVTSGNAVRVLGADLNGRNVVTVGAATAEIARGFGAHATALGETVTDLLSDAARLEAPVLVCRGVHTRVDLADALNARGLEASAVTVYDQVEHPLTDEARALLGIGGTVVAPVFSPRSAALLSVYPTQAELVVPAISQAAADAWTGNADIRVAQTPTSGAMAALVAEAL